MRFLTPFFPLVYLTTALSHHISLRDAPARLPHMATVHYSGSGCPSSAPAVDSTGSWNDLAFHMNAYKVSTLGSVGSSNANCEVHVQATGCEAGWQVGIKDVWVRGHLILDAGAKLDFFVTSFWSQDAAKTITVQGAIENNNTDRLDQIAVVHATVHTTRVIWSPCTTAGGDIGILNVNFRAGLQADGSQYGYFGKDGDVAAIESWGYVWRRC